jgi:3-phenylpropionate/trans-cinnamate dioxygenase ferredoxin reductase subunit
LPDPIVIIGGGQAALQTVESLRREGYGGALTLISEERYPPYQRPPLSKHFLAGTLPAERLAFRAADYYASHGVDLRLSSRVTEIDRSACSVRTEQGERIRYSALMLAVGARVRKLSIAGADLAGVYYLRTLDDARAIRTALDAAEHVAVIGGGFIGLEVAAVARKLGKQVSVIEVQGRLMPRAVAPVISEFFRAYHGAQGVKVLCSTQVRALHGDGRVRELHCADGNRLPADLVVVGIGVIPNVELARDAGLACGNGVKVDEYTRTSDPNIVAAGDCAEHPNDLLGRRLRLESVQNAVDQAKAAAATLAGRPHAYRVVPWFWSDQYDLKLQMAGLSEGYDRIALRGDQGAHKFSVFYFRDGALIAVDSVNRPADHMLARKLLAAHVSLSPEQAADEGFDLKALAT